MKGLPAPFVAALLVTAGLAAPGLAEDTPPFDLLIRGGHVIDAKNGIDAVLDVAVAAGRVASVAAAIPEKSAREVIDASGLYVVPGLVDMHAHVFFGTEKDAYLSSGPLALPPDGFTFRSGVTTVVDVGGAGHKNFAQFKDEVIERSKTRVLSFLNIVGSGMKGGAAEQNLADMDSALTAARIAEFPGLVVGVKVAHYKGPEWIPVDRAVEAGKRAKVPVMVDFGDHDPPLSLRELLLEHLRPGDIFTHTYAVIEGRGKVVDERGQVEPFVWAARKRGVLFDVGHGGASFSYRQAEPALRQGFAPDTISTDLHADSMNGGMKDLANLLSKLMGLGMSLPDVVRCATWAPARAIKREDLGHLGVGAPADIAILRLREGPVGFLDAYGERRAGAQRLEAELTLREGRVVWDLDGLAPAPKPVAASK